MTGSFFTASVCCARPTRRRLLAMGGAAIAGLVTAPAARAAGGAAQAISGPGGPTIQRYATSTADPWAVAHGLRAMGKGFAVADGRPAVDALLAERAVTIAANGKAALAFPPEVEVHPNSFLKTMLEVGVPLDHGVTRGGRRASVQELVEGARLLFRPSQALKDPNALPWTIIALTRTTPPVRGRWKNAWDEPVDLDAVVETGFRMLEQGSAPLARAMQEGRPLTERAPVHGFTCGGTHLMYSLLAAASAGYVQGERQQRLRALVDLLVWRLTADADLIGRFYASPQARTGINEWYHLDSRLKLLGHAEECLALNAQRKLVPLGPAQQRAREANAAVVRGLLAEVDQRNVGQLGTASAELFHQVIGDVCHARRGLTLG